MKIIRANLKGDFMPALITALEVLRAGGVIVYPTDTVYGLGANACDFKAVEQVFKIKHRPLAKPLPIIARNSAWVEALAVVPTKLKPLLEQLWPGPTTVVLAKRPVIPSIVTANQSSVAVRIPAAHFAERLLAKFGYPLTATSANLSGEESSGNIRKVISAFRDQLWKPDLIIDAGNLPKSPPSAILF